MGLISAMACAICWDRNCNHTWEEQESYCEDQRRKRESDKKKIPEITVKPDNEIYLQSQYDRLYNLTFEAAKKLERNGILYRCSEELRNWFKVAKASQKKI